MAESSERAFSPDEAMEVAKAHDSARPLCEIHTPRRDRRITPLEDS